MVKVYLRDGCFPHAFGAGFGSDAVKQRPEHIEWVRVETVPDDAEVAVYTDVCLGDVELNHNPRCRKIAWLIEPPGCGRTHYARVVELASKFDHILTFSAGLLGSGISSDYNTGKWRYYPLGGTWVHPDDWALYVKTHDVSIIASEKNTTEGHRLRHDIIRTYGDMDVYGRGYRPILSKIDALVEYRYSIVVEAWKGDHYFSEKLIDCFATGTIPIYWGSGAAVSAFDANGIIRFHSLEGLRYALEGIGEVDYQRRLEAVQYNMQEAQKYRCPDDWIATHYPDIFKGKTE